MTTRQTLALLRDYESRNVTFMEPDGSWPIVWDRAKGVQVWDADGKRYLDLTAAFGVAAAGHGNPRVIKAGQSQMDRLLHAMGDVHPHALKAQLARELSRITFERWTSQAKIQIPDSAVQSSKRNVTRKLASAVTGKTIFASSGFEAVEAALKTALLATGRPGVIAFAAGYHGLGYGALNATHRDHFRSRFRDQLAEFGHFVPFPTTVAELERLEEAIRRLARRKNIGAILIEPIQVRGGINLPPRELLPMLRRWCDEHEALLILDEIYTGF